MPTMTEKRAAATKRRKARKEASGFSKKVFIAAKFERKNPGFLGTKHEYSYTMHHLRADESGNLVANAGCDDVYVCKKGELPELIAFLQKLNGEE